MTNSTDPLREQVAHGQQLRDELLRLLLQRTVYATAVALSDRLLPLFATRERAAAEPAWFEGAQAATDWIKEGGWVATMPDNPYTVRAQLEGDGA